MLEPTCSGLSQKDKDRWREWQEFGSLCENDVCCASDEEDCCEPNVVAISFLVFALADVVFLVWLCFYKDHKYKCRKIKEPDEEARHGDSSEPAPCPVDPLTVPCPSCRSRVVHNSGEGKDAFFKCSSCSRYLTYGMLCALARSQAEAEAEEARLATQAEEEIPAPVERPSFTRKLSSFLFGEEEPVAESEGVEAEAMRELEELEPER
jgi:hypothetical protein